VDHLLFCCPIAIFLWSIVTEVVDWPANPHSILDLLSLGRLGNPANFSMVWVGAVAVLWSLWTIHNKLIFEDKVMKKPADAVFRVIHFLQLWCPLWEEDMQLAMDWVIVQCKKKMRKLS
jgi:hypothetical protein